MGGCLNVCLGGWKHVCIIAVQTTSLLYRIYYSHSSDVGLTRDDAVPLTHGNITTLVPGASASLLGV